jgi:hypothetical protein
MQPVNVLPSAEDRKALPFERVARSGDDDGFGEVVVRGSLL